MHFNEQFIRLLLVDPWRCLGDRSTVRFEANTELVFSQIVCVR